MPGTIHVILKKWLFAVIGFEEAHIQKYTVPDYVVTHSLFLHLYKTWQQQLPYQQQQLIELQYRKPPEELLSH